MHYKKEAHDHPRKQLDLSRNFGYRPITFNWASIGGSGIPRSCANVVTRAPSATLAQFDFCFWLSHINPALLLEPELGRDIALQCGGMTIFPNAADATILSRSIHVVVC
jgi:hypothetical protein